ncbi:MAG: hypothetical protein H7Y00_07315 [Fimbriimonadaceae bacterium]|nr:hypothetical protein [Chitinophagales bacterium]
MINREEETIKTPQKQNHILEDEPMHEIRNETHEIKLPGNEEEPIDVDRKDLPVDEEEEIDVDREEEEPGDKEKRRDEERRETDNEIIATKTDKKTTELY